MVTPELRTALLRVPWGVPSFNNRRPVADYRPLPILLLPESSISSSVHLHHFAVHGPPLGSRTWQHCLFGAGHGDESVSLQARPANTRTPSSASGHSTYIDQISTLDFHDRVTPRLFCSLTICIPASYGRQSGTTTWPSWSPTHSSVSSRDMLCWTRRQREPAHTARSGAITPRYESALYRHFLLGQAPLDDVPAAQRASTAAKA